MQIRVERVDKGPLVLRSLEKGHAIFLVSALLNQSHEAPIWGESHATVSVLRVTNELQALVAKTPDSKPKVEITNSQHMLGVGRPSAVSKSCQSLIYLAAPFAVIKGFNISEASRTDSH